METPRNKKDVTTKITYYDEIKKLDVTFNNKKPIIYHDVISYALSPHKKYLIIMEKTEKSLLQAALFNDYPVMSLLNMETGEKVVLSQHILLLMNLVLTKKKIA